MSEEKERERGGGGGGRGRRREREVGSVMLHDQSESVFIIFILHQ